jgi:hypothetical protein
MESLFSFPVGLLHPLQHAGLSRRTPDRRQTESCSYLVGTAIFPKDYPDD